MSLFLGTLEMESQSCPETVPVGVPGLWDFIAPRLDLRLGRGLNQSCSPQRELSNAMSHSRSARREHVDSRLLVVGSQTASLTPGPSFAHNLGCRLSKWPMRSHFRYLRFETFPMTPRTPQCEVFWALLSSSEHLGVPEDSKSITFPSVGLHPHTWPKWGCDTYYLLTTRSIMLGQSTLRCTTTLLEKKF
jgi:hypothetical protein